MKGSRLLTVAIVLVALGPAAQAALGHEELRVVIRHQVRGCHVWGVEGGRSAASIRVRLDGDTPIVIANRDVAPHRLIKVSGPRVSLTGSPNMNSRWSAVEVRFSRSGVYRFTTREGKAYTPGVRTIGKDNVLRLTVVVA